MELSVFCSSFSDLKLSAADLEYAQAALFHRQACYGNFPFPLSNQRLGDGASPAYTASIGIAFVDAHDTVEGFAWLRDIASDGALPRLTAFLPYKHRETEDDSFDARGRLDDSEVT